MSLRSSFTQIPGNWRLPLFMAEIRPVKKASAGSYLAPAMILAQKLPAAPAEVSTPYLVTSKGQAAALFGRGSPAHLMCVAFFAVNPTGELWVAAQTDADGATAATQTIVITGPATAAGTLYLYVGAKLVQVGVANADTATTIGDAIAAAINAVSDLPVTAANVDGTVTLTCKVKGTVGNLVTLAHNATGLAAGEETPAGVTVTLGADTLAGGATDPAVANWTASLGEEPWDHLALQFSDASAVAELQATLQARWDASSALDGQLYVAKADSVADHIAWAAAVNSSVVSVASYPENAGWLTPAYELAAVYMGLAALRLGIDPAAPIHLRALPGVWARGTNFTPSERNTLANAGCATFFARGGAVYTEFEATTRRTDAFGDEDLSYEVIQTPATLSRVRRRFGADIQAAYPEHKLVDDGTSFGEGAKVVTPSIIKGFAISRYRAYERDGLVEKADVFAANLVVERDSENANRVNGYLPPDVANQFRLFAGILGFNP